MLNRQVQELLEAQIESSDKEDEKTFQLTPEDKIDALEKFFRDMYEGTDKDPRFLSFLIFWKKI